MPQQDNWSQWLTETLPPTSPLYALHSLLQEDIVINVLLAGFLYMKERVVDHLLSQTFTSKPGIVHSVSQGFSHVECWLLSANQAWT